MNWEQWFLYFSSLNGLLFLLLEFNAGADGDVDEALGLYQGCFSLNKLIFPNAKNSPTNKFIKKNMCFEVCVPKTLGVKIICGKSSLKNYLVLLLG